MTVIRNANALAASNSEAAAASELAAALSAASAATARDASIAAWAASMTPAETLPAISQSLHIGAIVKAIIYDTSKDSDGGAWRKRCADKSWYTETLGGSRWIGQQATIGAAWTAAGSATGAVFQASATAGPITSGKYYSADSATTVTEVYRGISREFPEQVAIVAETARVVIYDLTVPNPAMWMVFVTTANQALHSGTITSLAAVNGRVVIGMSTQMIEFGFIGDRAYKRNATDYTCNTLALGSRNTAGAWSVINTTAIIVNASVYDVAITVLDNAPIDPATGLPTPTIAVGTAGGATVITDDATVVTLAQIGGPYTIGGSMQMSKEIIVTPRSAVPSHKFVILSDWTIAQFGSTANDYFGIFSAKSRVLLGSGRGLQATGIKLNKLNPSQPFNVELVGLCSDITNAYNTGWQVGDIRLATLADTVAETVTASGELHLGANFTDLSGFSAPAGFSLSVVGGALRITRTGAGDAQGLYISSAPVTTGKTYVTEIVVSAVSGAGAVAYLGGTFGGGSSCVGNTYYGAPATLRFTTVASGEGTGRYRLNMGPGSGANPAAGNAGDYIEISSISVKLATPDRSVKNKGLILNGSLTKTAVASAAALVSYNGFSASNFLEQAYAAEHDYSTTGFSGICWLKEAPNSAIEYLFNRDSATPARAIRLWVSVAGYLVFELYDGTTTRTATGTVAVDDTTWKCVMFDYSAGTLNIYVNTVLYATATGAALLTLNNAAATLRIGESKAGGQPLTNGSLALFRMSATVMSADQREHIYRTELPLFQANAQCCIAGTSTAVTALAHDDTTDLLHVGTSWGRSGFKGLLRVDSEATTTGALTSLSASRGLIITGGTSAKVYQPAMLLRDELRRRDEARKALGKVPVFFDFTATSSQTAFVLPKGYTAKGLYKAGVLMRETTSGTYWTRSNDGFAETCTLSVGATTGDWISIMATRNY